MIDQRKTVSVVFADLVDSTALAERHDPEVLAGILRRYFAALCEVVEKHGGTIEKFSGGRSRRVRFQPRPDPRRCLRWDA